MKILSLISGLFLTAGNLFAAEAFELPQLFSDGAVFQRESVIPVWGKYKTPGMILKAEFAGKTVHTQTSTTGEFKFYFPAMKEGGPYTLKLTALKTDDSITINDILVGEVWLASGQSNMAYLLGTDWIVKANRKEAGENLNEIQLKEFVSTIRQPDQIRCFNVQKNAHGVEETVARGAWKYVSAENAPEVSAAAAWFARELQQKLNVPVGIIVSAWGGTPVEAWTSRAALLRNPETHPLIKERDSSFEKYENWIDPEVSSNWKKDSGNKGFSKGYAKISFDDKDWKPLIIPGSWIRQNISGNGSIWARKEVELPESWKGCDLILHTGGIDKHDTSYFNGKEIGKTGTALETEYWDKKRAYTIPGKLVKPGKNVIAIRAYSFIYDGAFTGGQNDYFLENKSSGEKLPIAGTWKSLPEENLGVLVRRALPVPGNPITASTLFNGMIRPLIPYAIRGAIWYQGETNAGSYESAIAYQKSLAAMINDWRFRWELGDFPFIQMQLAFYNPKGLPTFDQNSPWAFLRESQRNLCKQLPNVFMASAIDAGDPNDIHPQDKKTIGKRFAANALHHVYHQTAVVPCGPEFETFKIEGEWIRLSFRYGDGLNLKGDFKKSFYLSDNNQVFLPADEIRIEGNTVLVRKHGMTHPVAVRYAWSIAPEASLYNAAGLPASSFRTDNWLPK